MTTSTASVPLTYGTWTSIGTAPLDAAVASSSYGAYVHLRESDSQPAAGAQPHYRLNASNPFAALRSGAQVWATVAGSDPTFIATLDVTTGIEIPGSSGGGGGGGSNGSVGSTGAAVPSSATAVGFQNAAGNLVLPTPSAGLPVADSGAAITGASIPAGGVGLTGWLSAIWSKLTGTLTVGGTVTANLGALGGAALDSTSQAILTALQAQRAETIWTDDTNAFFVRIDNGGSISWLTISGGASAAPGTGARPAAGASIILDATRYQATAAGTGYAIGDYLSHVVTADPSTGAVIANFWLNVTQNTKLASAPSSANITPIAPLPAGAATSALQTAMTTALGSPAQETGNLATIAANVSTATNQTAANTTLASILAKLSAALATTETYANLATAQVSVAATATLIVAARTGRKEVTIVNHGATAVYLGPSGVATTTGQLLAGVAGEGITYSGGAAVYGIAATGSQTVSVAEVY